MGKNNKNKIKQQMFAKTNKETNKKTSPECLWQEFSRISGIMTRRYGKLTLKDAAIIIFYYIYYICKVTFVGGKM